MDKRKSRRCSLLNLKGTFSKAKHFSVSDLRHTTIRDIYTNPPGTYQPHITPLKRCLSLRHSRGRKLRAPSWSQLSSPKDSRKAKSMFSVSILFLSSFFLLSSSFHRSALSSFILLLHRYSHGFFTIQLILYLLLYHTIDSCFLTPFIHVSQSLMSLSR